MNSTYRHPKHDAIVARLREDLTDSAIAAELKTDRRAVARVRSLLGLPVKTNATTPGDKLDRYSGEPDANGHVTWTGRTSPAGAPLIRQQGKEIPAAHVAFERRTGRKPVGTCRADCDLTYCVAPDHVTDDLERRGARALERTLYGLEPQPWDECPEGHGWDADGRFEPDLTPYCRACNTLRAQRSRTARKETLDDDLEG